MRLVFLLCLLLLVFGCSKDSGPVADGDSNVLIILNFPNDPLVESIISYSATVTADDILIPFEQSSAINPAINQSDSILVFTSSGLSRKFTLHFFQGDGGLIFWGRDMTDVLGEDTTEIAVDITQAAAGSATRVKIFRDNLPWNSDALDNVLTGIGLTLGTGTNQYQIISSNVMDTISLTTGEDLVIIANDQSQEFYDNYFTIQTKIDAFINGGGTILWEACDLGWARGSIEQAGITLPGEVRVVPGYQSYNYLTSTLWQITSGLDSTLYGTYASHEGFINLPNEAVAYTIDGRGLPTLLSFNIGTGWVIISGQPLEYTYDRVDSLNAGYLLPNIISYILDLPDSGYNFKTRSRVADYNRNSSN